MEKMPWLKPITIPDILVPPHIISELLQMIICDCQPTVYKRGQLASHIAECIHCKVSLELLITVILNNNSNDDLLGNLFMLLKNVSHKVQEQEECAAAYAETLEIQGIEEANERFPELVEHLKHCESCLTEVENMRALLMQAQQARLIASL